MSEFTSSGCTPDKCSNCPGCGGEAIEKIAITIEWRHKGKTDEDPEEILRMIQDLAGELIVSGVELTFINNTYQPDIEENSSAFFINGHPLSDIVPLPKGPIPKELVRKGIFQVLLQNL